MPRISLEDEEISITTSTGKTFEVDDIDYQLLENGGIQVSFGIGDELNTYTLLYAKDRYELWELQPWSDDKPILVDTFPDYSLDPGFIVSLEDGREISVEKEWGEELLVKWFSA